MSIDVDVLSGEVLTEALTSEQARELTEQIAVGLAGTWQLVKAAYNGRAWLALGYATWDDYCGQEFGGSRITLPREERREVIASLADAGLSIRAIAAATGAGRGTVQRDLAAGEDAAGVPFGTPADRPIEPDVAPADDEVEPRFKAKLSKPTPPPSKSVTGLDGKTYTKPPTPATQRRKPLTDQAERAGWELTKAIERVTAVSVDDRFAANKEQVAALWNGHLSNAIKVLTDLAGSLNTEPQEAR